MVELVNNHVLFPNPANWTRRPKWQRSWQNEVADAVTVSESRVALRSDPLAALTFLITPQSQQEQARFDDRVRAAKKLGLACAPLHGFSQVLAEDVAGDEAHVLDGREWNVGDYIFFRGGDDSYESFQVETASLVSGVWILGLSGFFTGIHLAGELVWPMIFGTFSASEMSATTPNLGQLPITIAETLSPRSAQIGAVAPVAADEFALFKT